MFRIKSWTEPLWRVDSKRGESGRSLRNLYDLDRPTYFLTDPEYVQGYIDNYVRKNRSGRGRLYFYIKKFVPLATHSPIRLLDMSHADTIRALLELATPAEADALRVSFQIQPDNSVLRFSDRETKHIDDKSLAAICRLMPDGLYGYYVEAPGLHPEVGLCPNAFPHFMFNNQIERVAAGRVAGKQRSLNNRNKRNSGSGGSGSGGSGSGNGRPNKTVKRMRFNN